MTSKLTRYERETIILLNEEERLATIFTYKKSWHKHLEQKLGLTPINDNGDGGRTYEIDKKYIKPPRAPKKLSDQAKAEIADRLLSNRKIAV